MNIVRGSLQFSLTNTTDMEGQDDSQPIVLNGATATSGGVLIDGLASPDSVVEDPLGSSVNKY